MLLCKRHRNVTHGHHHHRHEHGSFDRAFAVGIALNLGFVLVEAYYGWRVDSLALLADAGHNLSDVAGLVLAWAGALAGRMRPNARHTYGWKRASIVAAFFNALLLLVAIGSLGWEAIERLREPEPGQGVVIMAVAAVGIVVNASTALLFMRGRERDLNIRGAFIHMAADALVSAAVVVSGALLLWLGWDWIDPVMSLVIALVILAGTWSLFRQSLNLLFDAVPERLDPASVRTCLAALPGVSEVRDLHVWAMGTSEVALTAHLVMPGGYPDDAFFRDAAERLHDEFEIHHVTLQVMRSPIAAACDSGIC